ncbi:hypothetical protein EV426DRAFT_577117 [Tirmania nivea]|nr:hypothetical protein EV426DRAFT_577117 [Tirmania nivea]
MRQSRYRDRLIRHLDPSQIGEISDMRPRTDVPNSSPESLNAEYDCDRRSGSVTNLPRIIQWYIETAKLYIQAHALIRKSWPTRNEAEQMVDWAWTKAIGYHDKRTNVEMPLPAMGNLENKLAREILKRRVIIAHGYLVSACRKNIDHLYDLKMKDPTVVRERVQELVD